MSEAPEGFSITPHRKLSDDEFEELRKALPSVRLYEQANLIEHQAARIKELEAQLAEVFKKISDLDAFIDRLTKSTSRR
jgi:hypothetical protein